jgi:hypothetical protein
VAKTKTLAYHAKKLVTSVIGFMVLAQLLVTAPKKVLECNFLTFTARGQCYKTFYGRKLQNKLEHLSLASLSSQL